MAFVRAAAAVCCKWRRIAGMSGENRRVRPRPTTDDFRAHLNPAGMDT